MGGRNCCVRNCRRRSHDHRGRKIPNGLTFHCFPAWRRNEGGQISELTRRRRLAWVAAVGRSNITFNHIPSSMRVCSRHFHSGKPAYEMLESDPDWVPSLQLGHSEGSGRRAERLLSVQPKRDRKLRWSAGTGGSKHVPWTDRETLVLINTWGEDELQREMRGIHKTGHIFSIISNKMADQGYSRTPEQCQTRLKRLKSSFGQCYPNNMKGQVECKFYNELRRIFVKDFTSVPQLDEMPGEPGDNDVPSSYHQDDLGPVRPAVLPWREAKSLLQSVLQRKNNIKQQPGDETHERTPAVNKTDVGFRDFFRDALEASLESSSRSRAPSTRLPSISVELNFKLPPVKEENQTSEESSSSSSCCLNCARLQRRIMELEEKLSRLTGGQEDVEASPVFNEAPLQPDQDLQSPGTVHIEEEKSQWMEPISPPEVVVLHEGDQNVDSADESTPTSPAVSQDNSSKHKHRPTPRFRKAWLKMFWFLRYSPTLDQMWCHVCRLHADKCHQNLALIKGSSKFKKHSIKKHSDTIYHKDNLERHKLHMCDLKL